MAPKFVERAVWAVFVLVALGVFYYFFGTEPGELAKQWLGRAHN